MNCEDVQALLAESAVRGVPLPLEARRHLDQCPDCRASLPDWQAVAGGLLHSAPAVEPPPALRTALLTAARSRTPRRRPTPLRWLVPLGLAAALALAVWVPLHSGGALAASLPDPAVVVTYGDALVVANNGPSGGIGLIGADGRVQRVQLSAPRPAWYTEGVRLGGRVYLADAGNDRIVVLDVAGGRVEWVIPMAGGVAGLAAAGGSVLCKTADGEVSSLNGAARRLTADQPGALPGVMDAVALHAGTIYATHHARGDLYLLDPATLALRARVHLGGEPVALAPLPDGLLALDHAGALLWLNDAGQVTRRLALPGHPDKLVLSGDAAGRTLAFVSDRAGQVTRIDLASGAQHSRSFTKPMDLSAMPGGHLALADSEGGVKILDADLAVMHTYGGR